MVLGIKQYPDDVDADELIEFIDASIAEGSLSKNMAHVSKLTFNDGKDDFLEQDNPMIKKLRWSFYDACSRFWGMDVFDYNITSWVYVDWNKNPIDNTMNGHTKEPKGNLSGIMYVQGGESGTTMLTMPR